MILGQNSIGYIATLNYRYDNTYYEDAFNGTVLKETSGLAQNTIQQGEVGQVQALASALFGLVFKTNKSKHKITFLNNIGKRKWLVKLTINNFSRNKRLGIY